jgi:hypothetical protein
MDPANHAHRKAIAEVVGVTEHEAGHANHTLVDWHDVPEDLLDAAKLLEEIRMEARVAAARPQAVAFIQAAIERINLKDAVGALMSATASPTEVATLLIGRAHAGTLTDTHVAPIRAAVEMQVGPDLLDDLEALYADTVRIDDGDLDALIDAARRYVDLDPTPPESAGGGGSGESGGGDGDDEPSEAQRAMAEAAQSVAAQLADEATEHASDSSDMARDVDEITGGVEMAPAGSSRPKPPPKPSKLEAEPSKKASHGYSLGGADTTGAVRPASAKERGVRRRLARRLMSAQARSRTRRRELRDLPPGRLSGRGMMARAAQQAAGLDPTAPEWRVNRYSEEPNPRLNARVYVDASGSMRNKEEEVAAAGGVICGAVHDAGGHACLIAFGTTPTPLIAPGDRRAIVPQFSALGRFESIGSALRLGERMLPRQAGRADLTVIVSDGHWVNDSECYLADAILEQFLREGRRVVLIDVGDLPEPHPCTTSSAIATYADLPNSTATQMVVALRNAR